MMIQKALHRIRPHDCLNNRFLFYSFLQMGRAGHFAPLFTGSTIKHFPSEKLALLEVTFPKRAVQERIANTLTAYDDLMENNRRRMALLEESARLLYREWFVHLRFPGHEHTRITNGVPEGWRKGFIGGFVNQGTVNLQTGPFGTQLRASDYTESGTPVINVRNIGYGTLRPDKIEFVPEEIVERLGVHILRAGDIVFGRKGAVDRHLFISSSEDGWMQGSDCIRLRVVADDVCPVFLSFAFREEAHKEWMLTQCGNKATMASLNQDVIGRIATLIPSAALMKQFQDFAANVLHQITNLAQQTQKLRTARDLLLPRLMSGEIEV
jgi:type I restriction enzyme S subunit